MDSGNGRRESFVFAAGIRESPVVNGVGAIQNSVLAASRFAHPQLFG